MCAWICVSGVGPKQGMRPGTPHGVQPKEQAQPKLRLDSNDFRCIIVGDSQTAAPNATRIRTQTHRWDAPILGELVVIGNPTSGYLVNNGNAGSPSILYQLLDVYTGWGDAGPNDFLSVKAHQWVIRKDIDLPNTRIGRFRLRFGEGNTQAPWDVPWGIDTPVRARIVVRTSPQSVPAIEVRSERGGQTSTISRAVHELSDTWGVQVIEHFIPADFAPGGDDVGVGIYLPSGYVEGPGQRLQILGVFLEQVDAFGNQLPGTMIGYHGRGGWSIDDHLNRATTASRVAQIHAVDADHVLILLGHNQEPGGMVNFASNLDLLVGEWELAYKIAGRRRPHFIYVCPWTIINTNASSYLLEVERAMRSKANQHRGDAFVNFLPIHDYTRPDIFDPSRYILDGPLVHPGDVPTAVNLAQDMYEMLFEGRRD